MNGNTNLVVREGGLRYLLFVDPKKKMSHKKIIDQILRCTHITRMSMNEDGREGRIWTYLRRKVAGATYLQDTMIRKSMEHATRRLENDRGKCYEIVVGGEHLTEEMNENFQELIAGHIFHALKFFSLYDPREDRAGLFRRQRLVGDLETLIDGLQGSAGYSSVLSEVTWFLPDRMFEDEDLLQPYWYQIDEALLESDVERYVYSVTNRPIYNQVYTYLKSSVFVPLFSTSEIVRGHGFHLQATLVQAVNALPYMAQINRIVLITMFSDRDGTVTVRRNADDNMRSMVLSYINTFSQTMDDFKLFEAYKTGDWTWEPGDALHAECGLENVNIVLSSRDSQGVSTVSNLSPRSRSGHYVTSDQLLRQFLTSNDPTMSLVTTTTSWRLEEDQPTGLQAVELVVNSGTNRDFLLAAVLELSQNTIDATRLSLGEKGMVDVAVHTTRNARHVVVSVTDSVGISEEALGALYIPFYSSKKQGDAKSTGEMGTGFFNVFRGSDLVAVETRTATSAGVAVESRPLRRDDGTIVDIEYRIVPREGLEKGTTVSVFIPAAENAVGTNLLLYRLVKELLQRVTSVKLRLNKTTIHTKTPTVFYDFTNGIPFQPLVTFLRQHNYSRNICDILSKKIIIDLDKEDYMVNQSRDNLQLTDTKTFECRLLKLLYESCGQDDSQNRQGQSVSCFA
jgi:hypothetical protein